MKAFLAGLGLGAAVGILFAPQGGRKTRSEFAGRTGDWLKRIQNIGAARKEDGESETPQGNTSSGNTDLEDNTKSVEEFSDSEAVAEVLNTANKHDLMSVPGIGKGTARRIIDHRPYESREEVLQEGVLAEDILERVEEQLIGEHLIEKTTDAA